jgi:endonuclease YncB( thermonuclease family)
MLNMMTKTLLILLLCLPIGASAEIYQWQDASGKKYFSDRANSPNAKEIVIKAGYSFLRVKTVYDGDTVVLEDGQKIRLLGINTPEVQHRDKLADAGGDEAKNWLTDKLKNTKVRVETDVEKTDSYGRTLGYLFTENKEHINVLLAAAGLAQVSVWPPNLKYVNDFVKAGQQAEAAKLGIWQRPEYAAIPVEQLTETGHSGWTRLVGKVRTVHPAKKFVYLEFSDRFDARIEMEWLSLFPDLNSYQGKTIEVRGWLNKRKDKFSMLIRHPSAIK